MYLIVCLYQSSAICAKWHVTPRCDVGARWPTGHAQDTLYVRWCFFYLIACLYQINATCAKWHVTPWWAPGGPLAMPPAAILVPWEPRCPGKNALHGLLSIKTKICNPTPVCPEQLHSFGPKIEVQFELATKLSDLRIGHTFCGTYVFPLIFPLSVRDNFVFYDI